MAASLTSTDLTLDNTSGASIPGTPSAGQTVLYPKDDKLLYYKDDAGVERLVNVTAAVLGLGVDQTWQSVSRTSGTSYTNSTGRTIACQYAFSGGASLNGYFVIGGFTMPTASTGTSTAGIQFVATAEVPSGAVYSFNTNGSFVSAQELR